MELILPSMLKETNAAQKLRRSTLLDFPIEWTPCLFDIGPVIHSGISDRLVGYAKLLNHLITINILHGRDYVFPASNTESMFYNKRKICVAFKDPLNISLALISWKP